VTAHEGLHLKRCAEVYVPEGKLPLWRAEHDVETP